MRCHKQKTQNEYIEYMVYNQVYMVDAEMFCITVIMVNTNLENVLLNR
jgi:hypothetical protein